MDQHKTILCKKSSFSTHLCRYVQIWFCWNILSALILASSYKHINVCTTLYSTKVGSKRCWGEKKKPQKIKNCLNDRRCGFFSKGILPSILKVILKLLLWNFTSWCTLAESVMAPMPQLADTFTQHESGTDIPSGRKFRQSEEPFMPQHFNWKHKGGPSVTDVDLEQHGMRRQTTRRGSGGDASGCGAAAPGCSQSLSQ